MQATKLAFSIIIKAVNAFARSYQATQIWNANARMIRMFGT